jgi:hypothetical protein
MIERSVRHHGNFRWKRHDVFLSEVFWGERIGLLPEDDRWFTIYFAEIPVARFDSQKLRVMPLQKSEGFNRANAGEGVPSPAPHPRTLEDQKVSGMLPAAYTPILLCIANTGLTAICGLCIATKGLTGAMTNRSLQAPY